MVLFTPTHRDASAYMRVSLQFRDVCQILFAVGLGRVRCVHALRVRISMFRGPCSWLVWTENML